MKLLYIYLEEDYKNIPKGGYSFDNEFKILFNKEVGNKKIELISRKEEYYNPFNKSIENITCIVGKNGIGKTTFFELLILPLLWRLDGDSLSNKVHLLFYDAKKKKFFIESYINDAHNWKLTVDGERKKLRKNIYRQNDKSIDYPLSEYGYSVLPFQMNIVFHSLSPFDRIYTLLKEKLAYAKEQRVHYYKRFKYIGINQIETNETQYEYMTIINLLNLFFNEHSKKMINNIGYDFENISINIDYSYFEIDLPNYNDLAKNDYFDGFLTEDLYDKMVDLFNVYQYPNKIGKKFINAILLKNLNISTSKNLANFIATLFDDEPTKENFINILSEILKNLENYFKYKKLFDKKSHDFVSFVINNKENIIKIGTLSNKEGLKEVVENNELLKQLHVLKMFTAKNIIDFNINLKKDNKEINFFRLSSGEKTLLSYFANITARITELQTIQKQDHTYDNVEDKTFLVLIDEVELHLHPEWQRSFIKQLNDFFKYKKHIKLQFIIATHSPFIVSDIFDENILYLGDKGTLDTKTFGGNIFDIFKDDFYVSNTIGAFSEQIIHELSEFLYFIFTIEKARKEENFFMLRDFFDLMYESTEKEQENQQLLINLDNFLYGKDNKDFKKKINRVLKNQYLELYLKNREEFWNKAKIIIDNIGEEVVNQHLKNMYYYVKDEV